MVDITNMYIYWETVNKYADRLTGFATSKMFKNT